jgi:hypothetical protein
MVVSIDKVVSDFIQQEVQNMDLEDIITSEVRDTWDMDELDRIDETVDRVDALEAWIVDAEDKLSIQNVINLENSIKNLCEDMKITQQRLVRLEGHVEELEEQASKSFIQKLMFWR